MSIDSRPRATLAPIPVVPDRVRAYPHTVVAVDVGVAIIRVAVLLGGRLGKVTTHRTDELLGAGTDLVPGLVRAISGVVPATGSIDLVGVALDARVDAAGRVGAGPRPAGVANGCEFRTALHAALGAPVLVDGATGLAALGETRQGAAKGSRDVALIALDRTIALGIVSDRRIVRGAHGAAGLHRR